LRRGLQPRRRRRYQCPCFTCAGQRCAGRSRR
jgi:hypothetical protein